MANSSLEFRDSLGANNQTGPQTATTVSAANSARTGFQIQNLSTNILYVNLGAGASTSVYSFILKASTGTADGTGGSFAMLQGGNVYRGIITVAGTSPSYAFLEF